MKTIAEILFVFCLLVAAILGALNAHHVYQAINLWIVFGLSFFFDGAQRFGLISRFIMSVVFVAAAETLGRIIAWFVA